MEIDKNTKMTNDVNHRESYILEFGYDSLFLCIACVLGILKCQYLVKGVLPSFLQHISTAIASAQSIFEYRAGGHDAPP